MKSWVVAAALLLLAACAGTPKQAEREIGDAEIDVIYVATPPAVVDAMLALAEVRPGDVLYDLGSGDGRINIEAARRFGVRGVGIELDRRLIAEATRNAREAGVAHLVRFRRQDLFTADFSEASVVTLYLLPELNDQLRPILLKQLKPGSRIVSHAFSMSEWPPEKEVQVGDSVIYRWTVPGLPRVELATDRGPIVLEVDPIRAPVTACNFLRYVQTGAYDGGSFFRTVRGDRPMGNPNPINVIQGGVSAAGERPPISLERTSKTGLTHAAGAVSMARAEPDTATSSFFIVLEDTPSLDFGGARNPDGQGFAAFGRVLSGMETARAIQQAPSTDEKLEPPVVIRSARVTGGEGACAS